MKSFLILILTVSLSQLLLGQSLPDSGFTNKDEAKNIYIQGIKEGKWIENYSADEKELRMPKPFYILTVYKNGNPYGIQRWYYMNGKLVREFHFINGKRNGLSKTYYDSGKLKTLGLYNEGEPNEIWKVFDENGKLKEEIAYTNGNIGKATKYDANGNPVN